MKNYHKNTRNLQPGDVISFTNRVGHPVKIMVRRITEDYVVTAYGRESFGRIEQFAQEFPDFEITRQAVFLYELTSAY